MSERKGSHHHDEPSDLFKDFIDRSKKSQQDRDKKKIS